MVVRREDGFEKRRVWRCGRCGVGVGYEIVGGARGEDGGLGKEGDGGRERLIYLLEGGLREIEGGGDGDGGGGDGDGGGGDGGGGGGVRG